MGLKTATLVLGALTFGAIAVALAQSPSQVPAVGSLISQGPLSGIAPVLSGTYTVATLPAASDNRARYAFVTDLGGGADMAISDGTNWKHIRVGVVTDVAIATSVTVTPLTSPPVMRLTGSAFTGLASINITTANLYPGYTLQLVVPSGVLSTLAGALGTIGVSVGGGTALPVVAGSWQDLQWNGTALVVLRKGTL